MKHTTTSAHGTSRGPLGAMDLHILHQLREKYHTHCLACTNPMYRLEFEPGGEDLLLARFRPHEDLCSYRGVMHGGVLSLLIDEAMTCCLMAYGVIGVTGDLKVRFHDAVDPGNELEIHTRVASSHAPLFHMDSALTQGGTLKVHGKARFMSRQGFSTVP